MRFVFNERKAAEAAAHLLRMAGGSMPYIKLIKLMYLADRRTLVETGFPITGDLMVSMDRGPVLSRVLDHISHGPTGSNGSVWLDFVSPPQAWNVRLEQEPPTEGELSDYEIGALRVIHEEYGQMNQWALIELLHDLPEWRDPSGSSLPIKPEDILRSAGRSDGEIAAMLAEAENMWFIDHRLRA